MLHDPLWMQAQTYSALEHRAQTVILGDSGVVASGDLAVAPRGSGANMSVDIAAGAAIVPGISGPYLVRSDATENRTITAAPSVGNARIDLVVARVRDAQATGSGSDNDWILEVITGTPASSPTVPPTPNYAVALARVALTSSTTSILVTDITSLRARSASTADRAWPIVQGTGLGSTPVGTNAATWGQITIPAPNRPIKLVARCDGDAASDSGSSRAIELNVRAQYGSTTYGPVTGVRGVTPNNLTPVPISRSIDGTFTPGPGEDLVVQARVVAGSGTTTTGVVVDRGYLSVQVYPA